jgi:hypothetical protein
VTTPPPAPEDAVHRHGARPDYGADLLPVGNAEHGLTLSPGSRVLACLKRESRSSLLSMSTRPFQVPAGRTSWLGRWPAGLRNIGSSVASLWSDAMSPSGAKDLNASTAFRRITW